MELLERIRRLEKQMIADRRWLHEHPELSGQETQTVDYIVSALEELAGNLLEGSAKDPASLRDAMLHTIACKAAIKAGWHTDEKELLALTKQVMAREELKYCPHGRPICITLSKKQLEKQFKRT